MEEINYSLELMSSLVIELRTYNQLKAGVSSVNMY